MNLTTQINIMIDTHPETSYDKCPGCSHCDRVRELGKQLDQTPDERYQNILAKGPKMRTSELKVMLENGVSKRLIRTALGLNRNQFEETLKEFRPKPNRKKNKAITPEEFIQCRRERMSYRQISEKYGIGDQTLNQYVREWKKNGAISKEILDQILKKVAATPLLTREQYEYAKEQGWSRPKMAREFGVGLHRVHKSAELYEVAE